MQVPFPMRTIDAILLDMDGTILNSIKTAERIWGLWAQAHGVEVESFLPTIHGVKSVETIRQLNLAGVNPQVEAAAITQAEIDDVDGIEAIAGAAEFLSALPHCRWGIVTSAPRALALRRIEAAGLPIPPMLVAAEDVEAGKPAPDCFYLGAKKLGTTADRCLVIEDSLAGITAAEKAGALVLVVTATHHSPMALAHSAISDYRDLVWNCAPEGTISIYHAQHAIGQATPLACLLEATPLRPSQI